NPVARLLRLGLRWWYRPLRLKRLHDRLVAPAPVYALGLYLVAATCLLLIALVLLRKGVPALIAGLMALTVLLFLRRAGRHQSGPSVAAALWQMGLILVFMGLGLTLAVEFVVLKNVDISRMNTVFKFYLQ